MNTHERRTTRTSNEPLWLIVERDGKSTSYEFPPGGDDTTVVVGSSERAQVRTVGAAPIAFYVERVENELCITSCYLGSDLFIDGRVVSGRRTIVGRATVEVAGARLVLTARDSPPTLPGYYVDATQPKPCSALLETPAPFDSSEKAPDVELSAPDAWFDATFHSDTQSKDAPPRLDELSAVRDKPASLKQVTVPPRPCPTVRRPYSDFAQTQELAPIQLLAIEEAIRTVELGPRVRESDAEPPTSSESIEHRGTVDSETAIRNCAFAASGNSEAPTERAIRIGSATSTHNVDPVPVVTQESVTASLPTRLLPSAPPRKRRPLLFLLGATLGTVLPALCLVGVGRLAVLSRNAPGTRTYSTYAATRVSSTTVPSGASIASSSAAVLPNVRSPVTSSSADKVPSQARRFKKKSSGSAASTQ